MSSLQAPAGLTPSASYSFTMRIELAQVPGSFAQVAAAIGEQAAILGAIDLVRVDGGNVIRDVTVSCADGDHAERVVTAVKGLDHVKVITVSDRTFLMHKGGKIHVEPTVRITTRDDLSMAYTPGVARVSSAIHQDPERAWTLTVKGNMVAVVTDGTAVLGLGDIGPEAAMPVMEGKAMLFRELAKVDAFPLCLSTKDVDEICAIVKGVAPTFGGINLEDISAPRCWEIERRLKEELDIPVFHDDQHGTAVVVLAALLNALRVVGKEPSAVKVVIVGAGAAGLACARIVLSEGIGDLIVADIGGILHPDRTDMGPVLREMAELTNPRRVSGGVHEALDGADVVIGVSGPGAIPVAAVKTMAKDAIVFALANPIPEVQPEALIDTTVAIMATGRSDYPNQINNVLAFPGIFRGALDVRAREINEEMKLAAARAIADVIPADAAGPEYIIPSVFNREVAKAVAEAVAEAAQRTGVARRENTAAAQARADAPPELL